jgi:hypothetical protein
MQVDGESRRSANGFAVPLRHTYWTVTQSPSDWPLQIIRHSNAAFRLNPVAAMIDLMWTASLTLLGHASHAASISETVAHFVALMAFSATV